MQIVNKSICNQNSFSSRYISVYNVHDTQDGQNKDSTILIEETSENTRLRLTFICAEKNPPLILIILESMSLERRALLKLLGAQMVLIPASGGRSKRSY